jgi:hypothetical protein
VNYKILRHKSDGWYLFSSRFGPEMLYHPYATRRQAITAVQMMRFEQEQAVIEAMRLLQDED